MFQTVSIVGMGALGMLFGKPLLENLPKGNLRMIADESRIARYRENPPTINGEPYDFPLIAPGADVAPADLVIVAVKSTCLEQAILDMTSQVGEKTVIISLLNGISSEEILEKKWPGQVLYAVSMGMDAQRKNQNMAYTQAGKLQFGEKSGAITERVAELGKFFTLNRLPHEICDNIVFLQWNKWMLNVGCNQVCAALGATYRDLVAPGVLHDTMIFAMEEVATIAGEKGIQLTKAHIEKWMQILGTLAPEGLPSMAQDMAAGRKSELEIFGQTVIALGQELDIPTPVNQSLVARITALEAKFS